MSKQSELINGLAVNADRAAQTPEEKEEVENTIASVIAEAVAARWEQWQEEDRKRARGEYRYSF